MSIKGFLTGYTTDLFVSQLRASGAALLQRQVLKFFYPFTRHLSLKLLLSLGIVYAAAEKLAENVQQRSEVKSTGAYVIEENSTANQQEVSALHTDSAQGGKCNKLNHAE